MKAPVWWRASPDVCAHSHERNMPEKEAGRSLLISNSKTIRLPIFCLYQKDKSQPEWNILREKVFITQYKAKVKIPLELPAVIL